MAAGDAERVLSSADMKIEFAWRESRKNNTGMKKWLHKTGTGRKASRLCGRTATDANPKDAKHKSAARKNFRAALLCFMVPWRAAFVLHSSGSTGALPDISGNFYGFLNVFLKKPVLCAS